MTQQWESVAMNSKHVEGNYWQQNRRGFFILAAIMLGLTLSQVGFWPHAPRTETQKVLDALGPEYNTDPETRARKEAAAALLKERQRQYYECVHATGGHWEVCR